MLSFRRDGLVYHRESTWTNEAVDEGWINGTALCTSPNGTFFLPGSDSLIVDIYTRLEFLGGKRT